MAFGAGLVKVSNEFSKGASDVGLWMGGCPPAGHHQDDQGASTILFPKKMLGLVPCSQTHRNESTYWGSVFWSTHSDTPWSSWYTRIERGTLMMASSGSPLPLFFLLSFSTHLTFAAVHPDPVLLLAACFIAEQDSKGRPGRPSFTGRCLHAHRKIRGWS